MLCISRKEQESIVLIHDGEEMAITVNRIGAEKVEIGIVAPQSVRIVRAELLRGADE